MVGLPHKENAEQRQARTKTGENNVLCGLSRTVEQEAGRQPSRNVDSMNEPLSASTYHRPSNRRYPKGPAVMESSMGVCLP